MTVHRRLSDSEPSVTVSDARLASIMETALDGIVVIDEHGVVLMFNRACEQMFGYAAREVLGRNVAMLMPAEDDRRGGSFDPYGLSARAQPLGMGRDLRARRKDGSIFPVDLFVGEAATPEGRQFTGILRDVSARADAEIRLNELQADLIRLTRISALDEMGLALAHELNQPLTAVMLYVQAAGRELGRALGEGSRAHAILEKARREAQRAGSIIQRLRRLAEDRAPVRRNVDLNAIVEDAVDLTLIGHDRTVRIVRDYRDGLPPIEVDQIQIQQVVVNLVRNAFEAVGGRTNPEIVVSTGLDDRSLLLCVADNGPGIPPHHHADLFRAFKTGKRSGMGLGLAISRTIVQSHGGELLVDPGGNGQGARFIVRLPLSAENGEAGLGRRMSEEECRRDHG